ncbi:MAG: hypothetical protein U0228_27710 [Myxococcaceae bacterium]
MLRRPRPPVDPALPTLRRRTSHLLRELPPRARAFVRALPLLLCTRLRRPSLDADPPGLARAPRRRRWGRLCEQLELPPPTNWVPIRPLVQSVVLAPGNAGLELLLVPIEGLSRSELSRVSARVDAIEAIAARHAPMLSVRLAAPSELTPALWAWAAVVAGELPPPPPAPAHVDWLELFSRAPTPLLRCLALLVPRDVGAPLDHLRAGLTPARPLGFIAHWSGHPLARDVAALLDAPLSPTELDGLTSRFRAGCLAAVRAIPLEQRRMVRALLRGALLDRRVPSMFREQLERLLKTRSVREVQTTRGWQVELEGFVLARAPTLDQARAFALAESASLAPRDSTWSAVRRLLPAPPSPRGVIIVEPGFVRHLVAFVPAHGRPRARRVDSTGLLRFVIQRHRAGVPIEVVTNAGCDPTLVARAAQLLKLPPAPGVPVALEIDGARGKEVLLLGEGRSRRWPLEQAFQRPRRVTWLPQNAEHARALRAPGSSALPTVHLVALPDGDDGAAIFTLDGSGQLLRERVARAELGSVLHEYREVLRHAAPPVLVSASVHPLLTSLDGRRTDEQAPLELELELGPRGERVRLDDEWFGTGEALSWSALGEAVLSRWAPGTWARVVITRVHFPAGTSPLSLLAARSRVLRRVRAQLRKIARALKAA